MSRAVQRGQRQAVADFVLHAGIRFHAEPLAQQRTVGSSSDREHLPHRVQPHRRVRARQIEVRQRYVASALRSSLLVPILVRLSRGAGPGILQRSADRSDRAGIARRPHLTMKTF